MQTTPPARTFTVDELVRMPDLERTVLGMALMSPYLADEGIVQHNHFRAEKHTELWKFLQRTDWRGPQADEQQALIWLQEHPEVYRPCGGLIYIQDHISYAPTGDGSWEFYRNHLIERYRLRRLGALGGEMREAQQAGKDADEIASTTQAELSALEQSAKPAVVGPISSARGFLQRRNREFQGLGSLYIPTGWQAWDDMWLGLPAEGVVLMLARSGMGKTSVINSLAVTLARRGIRVYLHGTETSETTRADAIIFGMAGIDPRLWGRNTVAKEQGTLSPVQQDQFDRQLASLLAAQEDYQKLPIYVSGAGKTVEQWSRECRQQVRQGCAVALVDYVQDFIQTQQRGLGGDKTPQVMHCSHTVKDVAAELHIPIVVAAQVSNEKSGLPRKGEVIPQMWDAQWASGLHQDAEEVYAINRGDYWQQRRIDAGQGNENHDPTIWGPLGVMQIVRRKSRTGELGSIEMEWSGPMRWVGPRWRLETPPVTWDRTATTVRVPAPWYEQDRDDDDNGGLG